MPYGGCAEASTYRLFESKGEVPAASPEKQRPSIEAEFAPADPEGMTPRERITHVFERLEQVSQAPSYRGCPYLAVLVELKDLDHPASAVARTVKQRMESTFRTQAERGGAADPDLPARRLMLVYDGASARAGSGAERLDDGLTRATAGGAAGRGGG
ncbi:hypothetical protein GCM10010121_005210 [Streptomyces brasiliensis]|uniref:Uncharacterized protein n=1 Tax=Streptomyces brasiliensis TaxID=1954 RepID=A0A917NFU4_9ACTN|nr:hypothetical protein GCM10010121_005210 [Streptomyces brasiliensis]